MEHVLMIGGSRKLRGVGCHYAEQGRVVSVIGRDKIKIIEMVAVTQKAPGLINPIDVDYNDLPALIEKLTEAVAHLGPPKLTIARMTPEATSAHQVLAGFLNEKAPGSRMFDIICGKPDLSGDVESVLNPDFKILCRRIMLGSATEGGESRPLTEQEICTGVMEAINQDQPNFYINH
jgi:hypothetical protein